MFDSFFNAVSSLLNLFYSFIPNYAVAIALLTIAIMAITTPLTMKSTRSMLQLQRLQPEMRRIQQKYKDDRQKLNEELMAFYQEHGVNPVGGCLPMLLQMPVFLILFRVVSGLTHKAGGETFVPKHLTEGQELYDALHGQREMLSFGIDLAKSASTVLGESFVRGLPYLALVGITVALSILTQRQIQGRSTMDVPGPQKMIMRIFPVMFGFISFVSPAALVVYFVVSSGWRAGQQWYITRSLYSGDDSPGAQAAEAMKELRKQKESDGKGSSKGSSNGEAASTSPPKKAPVPRRTADTSGDDEGPAPTSRTASKPHPRSRKKKKRR